MKHAKLAVAWAILVWMFVMPLDVVQSAFARGGGRGGRGGRGGSSSMGRGSTRGSSRDKDKKRDQERLARELRDALKRAAADDAV